MNTIGDALKEIIENMPFIEEGLAKGIINYSALAREIKPQIENKIYKSVKEGAIIMALKRMTEKFSKEIIKKNRGLDFINLTVRSGLSELTFLNSCSLFRNEIKTCSLSRPFSRGGIKTCNLLNKIKNLMTSKDDKKDVVCLVSEGIRETTIITNSEGSKELKKNLKGETLIKEINNLSAITIRLPEKIVYTSSVYYQILKILAWQNINIIEVSSTLTELTLTMEEKDVDRAFSILRNFKSSLH